MTDKKGPSLPMFNARLYTKMRPLKISVVENGEVWVLDRRMFQNIMMRSGLQRMEDSVSFLQSVQLLKNLNQKVLSKIADCMQLVNKFQSILFNVCAVYTSVIHEHN